MCVVLVSGDMMASSRLCSTAQRVGVSLGIAVSPGDLAGRLSGQTRLVIFDLSQPDLKLADAVAAVRSASPGARIIAFGPHVDEALLAAASSAGCDEVMSNGKFHREQEALLKQFCGK
jgi:DNA-binding NarL/FixJ family response regulator